MIRQSIEYPDRNYFVIVPEQFTMQTQMDLVRMHPRGGVLNIDILSFERLAYRIFDELGGNHCLVLEETGKNLVLQKIAEEKREELKLLGGSIRKPGYIREIKSVISEFTQYGVEDEQLEEMIRFAPVSYTHLKLIQNLQHKLPGIGDGRGGFLFPQNSV